MYKTTNNSFYSSTKDPTLYDKHVAMWWPRNMIPRSSKGWTMAKRLSHVRLWLAADGVFRECMVEWFVYIRLITRDTRHDAICNAVIRYNTSISRLADLYRYGRYHVRCYRHGSLSSNQHLQSETSVNIFIDDNTNNIAASGWWWNANRSAMWSIPNHDKLFDGNYVQNDLHRITLECVIMKSWMLCCGISQ